MADLRLTNPPSPHSNPSFWKCAFDYQTTPLLFGKEDELGIGLVIIFLYKIYFLIPAEARGFLIFGNG